MTRKPTAEHVQASSGYKCTQCIQHAQICHDCTKNCKSEYTHATLLEHDQQVLMAGAPIVEHDQTPSSSKCAQCIHHAQICHDCTKNCKSEYASATLPEHDQQVLMTRAPIVEHDQAPSRYNCAQWIHHAQICHDCTENYEFEYAGTIPLEHGQQVPMTRKPIAKHVKASSGYKCTQCIQQAQICHDCTKNCKSEYAGATLPEHDQQVLMPRAPIAEHDQAPCSCECAQCIHQAQIY